MGGDRIEVEGDVLAKSDDDDPLAVLWSEVGTVNYPVVDVVAEVLQGAANHVEGTTLVVRGQVLHVLQQEGARALFLDDAADIKE